MKIWCETCDGTGELDNSTMYEQDTKKCCDCNGKGYTENTELERLAKIGEATEKAFKENSCVLFIDSIKGVDECYEFELINVEQLLEWAVEND